jgi:ribosomal biogenesis protein LAS1
MYKVARHLGLPTALVELRHTATHQRLLSLPVLRKAAQRSLEWLWDNYWVKIGKDRSLEMDTNMDRPSETEEYKDLFRRILRPYKQSRVMRAKQKMPFDEDETIKASQRIQDTCNENIDKISILVEVLLEPRFIIPDGRR